MGQCRHVALKLGAGMAQRAQLKMKLLECDLHILFATVQFHNLQRVARDDKGQRTILQPDILDQGRIGAQVALELGKIERPCADARTCNSSWGHGGAAEG